MTAVARKRVRDAREAGMAVVDLDRTAWSAGLVAARLGLLAMSEGVDRLVHGEWA